ncbi:stalk domain-containing protein [Paenibacillus zanthoxyli]|uniref:stalk domain-containing protein n=1 Tax=Paenibacillus zanthoxyli TaxID=369399 RepID=UPI00046FD9A0|nr:stalk domain-containing protein [Paenibacillus zanthoxyli]
MKMLASLGCASILALTIVSGGTSFAAGEIEVIVNNNTAGQGAPAYLSNGTTMVPLNVVQQIPGISVSWARALPTIFRKANISGS